MVHSIHRDKLILSPDRQRQEFDPEALTDLSNSILMNGLLHPIVVRETPHGPVLVAGERRLRAMGDLWAMGESIRCNGRLWEPYAVPYITLGELSPLEAEEAELDENFRRKDLTWQEQSAALARLHRLRQAQAEAIGEVQQRHETVSEIVSMGTVTKDRTVAHQSLVLADHLSNPEVARASTAKEAFKILKRDEERKKNAQLAERVGRSFNSSRHKLEHLNCLDWLVSCPANTFDIILTDPPYGMGADQFGDGAGRLSNNEHHYTDSYEHWLELMEVFTHHAFRVTKPQAHCYIFCDFDRFHELKSMMQDAGWYVFRTPIIVYKTDSGRVPLPEHGPRRQHEYCLYAIKGNKPTTGIYSDVIPCRLEENIGHGANKPIELFTDLLRRSARPGDTVLDAFAGTGTIFPAAHSLKLYATGLELNPEYYGICVKRLNALDEQVEML